MFDQYFTDFGYIQDHLALMMELLGMMPRKVRKFILPPYKLVLHIMRNLTNVEVFQIALSGRYSRDFFNRYGDLRHIRRLRFWPLNKVLMEKYEFSEQDANNMTDFLVPILDFVPEKRPTAAQCLLHPWINAGPRRLEPSMPSTQNQVSDHLKPEKKEREKDEREAMEAGMSNIAISVDFKSGKDTQSSSKATMVFTSNA